MSIVDRAMAAAGPKGSPQPRNTQEPPQQPPGTAPAAASWPRDSAFSGVIVVMFWVIYLSYVRWDWTEPVNPNAAAVTGAFASNPAMRAVKLLLLAICGVIIAGRWVVARRTLQETNRFFLCMLALIPLSTVWSIEPGATAARFVTLLSYIAICMAATMTNWYRERFQDVVRPLMTGVCVGSLLIGLSYPDWIIEGGLLGQAWHGLLNQKNAFGQVASLAVIFWFHGWLARELPAWKALTGAGIGLACLLFSRSSTSLLALLFVGCLLLMLLRSPRTMRRSMPYFVTIFAIIVVVYALAVLKVVPGLEIIFKPVAMMTGKDMTFSNRSVIWDIIKNDMQGWRYLGAGYSAYWIGPDPSSPSYKFLALMYFYPYQSHNGYLEIANDLGYLGLVCMLAYLVVYVRQGIQLYLLDRNQGALYLCLFFHQCVINLSEATWFQVGGVATTSTMMFATFAMARTLAEYKRTGQLPPRGSVRG